ncbi:lytic transglycosylase domain-containing protein [Alterisphingorhabdus coralli]|uniref:Lytic transglycosylase domain-containing protein n=1 Tax=Alterisphingorhabdus coralli TaxID=3071408 RepID=A0AA97F439_9SPHN|nr:lytic transglycosylase domain-containing protein [Parasphingorhabdus sp. SCSIO 66989]WOE73964.1 lytic transglycosylase domain-containing protein [Parasphingorhabdus sp. SCSIO 66989]
MGKSLIGLSLAACVALPAAPAMATAPATTSFDYYAEHGPSQDSKNALSRSERGRARDFFAALDRQDWARAQELADTAKDDLLSPIFRAELYLAANSPRVEREPLEKLLRDAPYIPQAAQLSRLAERRGATNISLYDAQRHLSYHKGPPVRGKPRSVKGGNSLHKHHAGAILDAIKDSNPDRAMRYFESVDDGIDDASRTEWLQRISWSYYIENQPQKALDVSSQAITGSGPWLADSHWVHGLAAWRLKDYARAEHAFHRAGTFASNPELMSAGYYWASRAAMRSGQPAKVEASLRAAAQQKDALYSLLAREALGMPLASQTVSTELTSDERKALQRSPNAKMALALSSLGRDSLADELIRHEARRANGLDHDILVKIAGQMAMPRLQAWLGHYAPDNATPTDLANFPAPSWTPVNGWKVDPALVYAHVWQESAFRTNAVSPANARGLMQLRPGTAKDMARAYSLDVSTADLNKPEVNLALGQLYLETLSKRTETQGLLPKVMAAYNAGMVPVGRWNSTIQDQDDPLLYIESIPYYETRAYVGTVMRNYWKYEAQAGISSQSAHGMAQGLWPRFPNRNGSELVRLSEVHSGGD